MARKGPSALAAAAVTAAAAASAVYAFYVRPRIVQRWGAQDGEIAAAWPGDELIPDPKLASTRAITIQAPPERVWPWLVQIGYGRAGWYSYDALEKAAGVAEFSGGSTSARTILPEFQELQPGGRVFTHAGGGFYVDRADPGRCLVLRVKIDPRSGATADLDQALAGDCYRTSWSFTLLPVEAESTRLVVRFRVDYPPAPLLQVASPLLLEPVVFLMERKMLKGLQERAERR